MTSAELKAQTEWMRKHTDFDCPVCDKHCETQGVLAKHLGRAAHDESYPSKHNNLLVMIRSMQRTTRRKSLEALEQQRMACPLIECRASFRTLNGLRKHLSTRHR